MNLKEQFEALIHLPYDEYWIKHKGKDNTIDDKTLQSLVNICTDTDDISAMKLSFDRLDGVQEIPIDIKVPKFYIKYNVAKEIEKSKTKQIGESEETLKKDSYDPATSMLRETLNKMREMPDKVVPLILGIKKAVQEGKPVNIKDGNMPQVKHVMVANLLRNASKLKRFKAIELLFDQIDGKLTKTIALLGGEDVYLDDFNTLVAPAHAIKDENGVYIAENKEMTAMWLRGFAKSNKGLEILAKGLDDE